MYFSKTYICALTRIMQNSTYLTKISFSPLHVCACAFVCQMSSDGIPDFNFFDKMPSSSSQNKMSAFRHYAFRRHEHEQCEDQHNDQGMCVRENSFFTYFSCFLYRSMSIWCVCVCVCLCVCVFVSHISLERIRSHKAWAVAWAVPSEWFTGAQLGCQNSTDNSTICWATSTLTPCQALFHYRAGRQRRGRRHTKWQEGRKR
jgi:hypothetical protein